jgi:hypothetical protein
MTFTSLIAEVDGGLLFVRSWYKITIIFEKNVSICAEYQGDEVI